MNRNESTTPTLGRVRAYGLALLLASIGLALTLWVDGVVRDAERADLRSERAAAAQERVLAVQQQLGQAIQASNAVAWLFGASDAVTQEAFTYFAAGLLKEEDVAQAVSWAPLIPMEERSAFEQEARAAGLTGFAIVEAHPSAGRVAAGERDQFVPVRYVEPQQGHQRLLGFDLSADPARRAALEAARDTGRPMATAPINLARSKQAERGFDVVAPVYAGRPTDTAGRRDSLRGYAIAEIDAQRVLDSALRSFRHGATPMAIELVDQDADGEQLAFNGAAVRASDEQLSEASVKMAGRTWRIRAFAPPPPRTLGWVIPTGFSLTGLLVAYAVVLAGRKERVEHEVAVRTQELALATQRAQDGAERLAKLNAALMRRNAELDEFLFVACHDLQEPSRRVGLFSQLLQRGIPEEQRGGVARHLDGLQRAAARLQVRIRALHALSEVARGEPELSPVRVDDCVDAALSGLNGAVDKSGAHIFRSELPIVVGDARLLRRIYEELIDNALRYVDRDLPEIRLTAQEDAEGWILGVKDDGPGLQASQVEAAFAPFKRMHERPDEDRAGIGLTVARRAVNRMGGEIWMETKAGGGTHVRFRLPLQPEADHSAPPR